MTCKREAQPVEWRPMVFDGYYGRFVPVECASFDVTTTPDAVVQMPWAEAESKLKRRRRSGPRCDACRERRIGVQRSGDGALVICRSCARGVDVRRLDAADAIGRIVERAPAADRASLERRLLRRRGVRTARRERRANARLAAGPNPASDSAAETAEQR